MAHAGEMLTVKIPPPEELRRKRFRSEGGKPGKKDGDEDKAIGLMRELRHALDDKDDIAAVSYLRDFIRNHA